MVDCAGLCLTPVWAVQYSEKYYDDKYEYR